MDGVAAPTAPKPTTEPAAVAVRPAPATQSDGVVVLGLSTMSVREINQFLHAPDLAERVREVRVTDPDGSHNLAVGLDADVYVQIFGHAGYYVAGMNKRAHVTVHGNVERGVAENMMSGVVRVRGNASEAAGASAQGGLLIVEGNASGRCAISLKGGDVVVGGDVGHLSAFMAQAGRLVVCGDAGPGLGDSLYEAILYVRGTLHGLGADARQEDMTAADVDAVAALLERSRVNAAPRDFKKVASARTLYHWNGGSHQAY